MRIAPPPPPPLPAKLSRERRNRYTWKGVILATDRTYDRFLQLEVSPCLAMNRQRHLKNSGVEACRRTNVTAGAGRIQKERGPSIGWSLGQASPTLNQLSSWWPYPLGYSCSRTARLTLEPFRIGDSGMAKWLSPSSNESHYMRIRRDFTTARVDSIHSFSERGHSNPESLPAPPLWRGKGKQREKADERTIVDGCLRTILEMFLGILFDEHRIGISNPGVLGRSASGLVDPRDSLRKNLTFLNAASMVRWFCGGISSRQRRWPLRFLDGAHGDLRRIPEFQLVVLGFTFGGSNLGRTYQDRASPRALSKQIATSAPGLVVRQYCCA
jgi:hypothetical protein